MLSMILVNQRAQRATIAFAAFSGAFLPNVECYAAVVMALKKPPDVERRVIYAEDFDRVLRLPQLVGDQIESIDENANVPFRL